MTVDEWEQANATFLTDALAWLRARLERYAAALHGDGPNDEEPPEHFPLDAASDAPPALIILGRRFGLTAFELDVLLLCVGFELDTRIAGLCARAQDDPQRPYPTFALALSALADPAWDVTSLERPLRRWRLIDVERRAAQPLTSSPLHSDARTVDFVKGFNRIDERLTALVVPLDGVDERSLPASQRTAVERIVAACAHVKPGEPTTVQLAGADVGTKLLIAAAAARRMSRNAWRLNANWLPTAAADIDDIAQLLQREALLAPTLLLLDAQQAGGEGENDFARAARRRVARRAGDVLLATRCAWAEVNEPSLTLDVGPSTPAEQLAAWNQLIAHTPANGVARQLAAQFRLDLPSIERIAGSALSRAGADSAAERLWDECCLHLKPRLESLAQHIEAKAGWDDIVLPPEQERQLREIAAHVRGRHTVYEEWGFAAKMNRGLGISALFAGDSGTGKTMAAEVLANDLRLPLYRIDLSSVVSKYIGETEKNLRTLFDAADCGGFILFFDEADALFGKRSEVRDSHDRYANIEVNYLLQRIEAYRGLAILATNAKATLDQAFVRRLRFIVNFPHPGIADRKRIWAKTFPPQTPVADLDLDQLALLNATGGTVHSASLAAAFAAAANGGVVTTPLVLEALKAEYRKLNRPINATGFQEAGGLR